MDATYKIDGLHCSACVARVQKALDDKGIAAKVSIEPPRVHVTGALLPPASTVAAVVAAAGEYVLREEVTVDEPAGLMARVRGALKL